MTGSDLALLARTAVHLRPSQVAQRARLRAQHEALHRFPAAGRWLLAGPDPASAAGWPAGFVPLDARLWSNWPGLPGLREGRAELLRMTRTLARSVNGGQEAGGAGDPAGGDRMWAHWARTDWARTDWAQADAPALWRSHLHYWDWSWGLIRPAVPGRCPRLVRGALAVLDVGGQARPGRRVAPLPRRAARLVVLRSSPGPGGGQRRRGLFHRQPVHPRWFSATAHGNGCLAII